MPIATKSVVIVDDHDIVRFGLQLLLESLPEYKVLACVPDLQSALTAISHIQPDMVIADMSLGDSRGLDTVRAVVAVQAPRPVLVLSMHDELLYAEQALSQGAQGYLMKEKAQELLLQVVRNLLLGERWVSPRVSAQLLHRIVMAAPRRHADAGRAHPLSLRELEVLEKIGRGRTTKEIAYALNLSPRTVDLHRASIKKKLGFRSGAEVVAYAVARL